MAIKNLVTLGIGCSPGSTKYLLLVGLDIGAEIAVTGIVDLTLRPRTVALTLKPRTAALTLRNRSVDLTLEER